MADLNDLIARGPPRVDFSPLSNLFDSYTAGQSARRDQNIMEARRSAAVVGPDGKPDFGSTAINLLRAGDMQGATSLAHLADSAATRDLARAQFENTKYTQSPEYIGKVTRTRSEVENEFAPKTVDIKRPGQFGETTTETMMRGPSGLQPIAVQGQQPTAPAASGLTGDDYIKTLSPGEASIVSKVANYEIDPRTLSIKGGHRERIMAAASQYDPNYDAALAPARFAAIKEFNSGGPNSPAGVITSGNTAIQHLKSLSDAGQKLGGSNGWGPLNSPLNKLNVAYQSASNNPDLVEYNNTLGRFVEEATKFYRGIGGNEADIQRAIQDVTAAQSPDARNRAIATQADLMQSKINALQDRWRQATGPGGWNKVTKDFPIVQGKSVDALNEIMKRGGRPEIKSGPAPAEPGGSAGGIPMDAAKALKADPSLREQFDAKYGSGMAARVLGR